MAVMDAWALDQGVLGNDLITFMADPKSELTRALGMELTDPGPISKGLLSRSKLRRRMNHSFSKMNTFCNFGIFWKWCA